MIPIYTAPIYLHGTGTRTTNYLKTQPPSGVPQIAHPDDRATSIRPAKKDENVKLVSLYCDPFFLCVIYCPFISSSNARLDLAASIFNILISQKST